MKTLVNFLLLITIFCMTTTANAQNLTTADQVLAAYFKALGGKKVLATLKDLSGEAVMGTNVFVTMKYKAPLKALIISDNDKGQTLYKGVADGQNVSIEMGTNKVPLSLALIERGLFTYQIMPELYFDRKGVKSIFAGKETVDGKETYKLIHTIPDGLSWYTNYDTQTGLKVQVVVPNPTDKGEEITRYGDYRVVSGIKLPFMMYPGTGTMTIKAYRVNTGLSDAEFVVK
ncbi:hypothetical protein [Spirosoma aerolatum]|uniref:hypothetical protein n=1 Tax=Spirosoma aerolatum TaxID=1211326 RepID=UPI0009AD8C56|nr:hypothetical protein [Spirosoma aerolatum]